MLKLVVIYRPLLKFDFGTFWSLNFQHEVISAETLNLDILSTEEDIWILKKYSLRSIEYFEINNISCLSLLGCYELIIRFS